MVPGDRTTSHIDGHSTIGPRNRCPIDMDGNMRRPNAYFDPYCSGTRERSRSHHDMATFLGR
jgi:hypothetical protein